MLRDAMRRSRLPSSTLVFVGPKGCGKSSLLDTFLEGSASAHNPSGSGAAAAALTSAAFHPVLSYAYLDAADPAEQGAERDDSPPRVSVWSCSQLEFEPLLETVLRPDELPNMAVVVAVDLSRPWEIMDSLEK
ncbi:unnamed protein product, partial [Hapterophycus canaliculatus]